MFSLKELLTVNSQTALNFFFLGLKEVSGKDPNDDELLYVTSVLAHFSGTSRFSTFPSRPMAGLEEVFDNFVVKNEWRDAEGWENGGTQTLMFAGFFRDQLNPWHDVRWFDRLGSSLYGKASVLSISPAKQKLMDRMSRSFPDWAVICRDLSRKLREERYLFKCTNTS